MKTVNILFLITLAMGCVEAQDIPQSQVPSVVTNAFHVAYPQASDIEWELHSPLYKVEFEIDRADHDLWFDKEGKVVKHKQDIAIQDLPEAVTKTIQKDFSGYRVDDTDKIEEKGVVSYRVELDGKPNDLMLTLSANGDVLEKRND